MCNEIPEWSHTLKCKVKRIRKEMLIPHILFWACSITIQIQIQICLLAIKHPLWGIQSNNTKVATSKKIQKIDIINQVDLDIHYVVINITHYMKLYL